ncbi:MAG: SCP2 sterol-binding domain-containing protein [Actinomycetota bacterium]|nr:SCP2 sterol-binding domain-containing protein [Actinomycetota bacterium]MDP8953692.1 SCP2 sterol-binding domain-containing protein [Actinomycetota bacterium]
MVKYLSAEWMALFKELAAEFPETPGATARLQYVITGAPDGDVRYYHVIDNGHTVEHALGDDPETEVTLTSSYDDKMKVDKGELDANAAFMQGRVKVTGNIAKVMALLPLTNKPEYKSILAKVREQTEF